VIRNRPTGVRPGLKAKKRDASGVAEIWIGALARGRRRPVAFECGPGPRKTKVLAETKKIGPRGSVRGVVARATIPSGVAPSTDHRPYPRIDRPRLHALLDAAEEAPVILVRAPAGYGKTALLESWSADRLGSAELVWETLSRRDDEPRRFWSRLIAGLRRTTDERTAGRLGRIRLNSEGLTGELSPALAKALLGVSDPMVIVLDDFEHIRDTRVFEQLDTLVQLLTNRIQLVLSSRIEPGLHLNRMIVEGRAARVGVEDLAFTRIEAREVLELHGAHLNDDHLDLVMRRTEGWAAGLRLLGIAIDRHPAPQDFIEEFSGEDRSVADYLSEEILTSLDDEMRRFVLETCVVDELTGPVAAALSGRVDAEQLLDRLSRANALIKDVDNNGRTFRFHPLFADFLRSELHRSDPKLAHEQHRRAAALSGEAGTFEGVLAQAIAASDANLVEEYLSVGSILDLLGANELVIDSRFWRLPHSKPDGDPLLILMEAARSLAVGDIDGSTTRLTEAAQLLEGQDPSDSYRARVVLTICEAVHAAFSGDVERVLAAMDALERQAARATDDGILLVPDLRSVTDTLRGAAALSQWNWDEAEILLGRALVSARRARRPFFELLSASLLASAAAGRGGVAIARERGHEALNLASDYGLQSSPALVGAHLALAWSSYQRDELDEAEVSLAAAGRNQGAFQKSPPFALAFAALGAAIARGRGDFDAGIARLEGALDFASHGSFQKEWLAYRRAEILLSSGDPQAAARSIEAGAPVTLSQNATVAQVRLANGDPSGALRLLDEALDSSDSDDVVGRVLCWCIKARALDARGDSRDASRAFERALALAEPEGVKRVFLDQGVPMKDLLSNSLRNTHGSHLYARSLLDKLNAPSRAPVNSVLIDPLTDRELHVLRYLPSLLSASEIAGELYVSLNTVKTHLRSIYRKLGVSSRRGAVDRANELGIL
jgi:LuxR family transcriptional regulator, maltose regulon positive regulatory protein